MSDFLNSIAQSSNYGEQKQGIWPQLEEFRSVFVCYQRIEEPLKMIERCRRGGRARSDTEGVALFGTTGSGKTSLAKYFQKHLNSHPGNNPGNMQFLYVVVPSSATTKMLVSELLEVVKDPLAWRGTCSQQTARLIRRVKDLGVELIFIDEWQHLIDQESQRLLSNTLDWIKNLLIRTGIAVVLLGQPEAEKVLDACSQLSRRIGYRYHFSPFGIDTKEKIFEFQAFLGAIEKNIPLEEESLIWEIDMAIPIYHATKGYVGNIMKLLEKSIETALETGATRLTKKILVREYNLWLRSFVEANGGVNNPFGSGDSLIPTQDISSQPSTEATSDESDSS